MIRKQILLWTISPSMVFTEIILAAAAGQSMISISVQPSYHSVENEEGTIDAEY
jgi:hypothetical protein